MVAKNLPSPTIEAYEKQMDANPRWAMSEGSEFFEGKGKVQQTLRKIAKRLNELHIPYSIVGGMALFQHGHRRFTEDIDLLVTANGFAQIHDALDGLGYLRPFEDRKSVV